MLTLLLLAPLIYTHELPALGIIRTHVNLCKFGDVYMTCTLIVTTPLLSHVTALYSGPRLWEGLGVVYY